MGIKTNIQGKSNEGSGLNQMMPQLKSNRKPDERPGNIQLKTNQDGLRIQ